MPYIYKITNNVNQKIYIGKTSTSIEERWKTHCKDSKVETKEKRPLYSAMRKYGIECFSIEQIEEVENDSIACERERYWIEYYGSFKTGYNATLGGDGKAYADYDLIFALFKQGKNNKEIHKITNYANETIRKALEIKGIDREERKKRGYAQQSKKVLMIDKNTFEPLRVFSSMGEAERFLQKPEGHKHISEVCNGKRKSAYGYKWEYL